MEPPSSYRVSVINPSSFAIEPGRVEAAVCLALRIESQPDAEVRVYLTSDEDVRSLNCRYRNVDEPTDVLTFPEQEDLPSGDIAIATQFAANQAKAHGIAPADEIVLLAIHGSLHLAGLDDESDEERDHMVSRMNAVASILGLPSLPNWSSVHS